jgi:hypothetical protein
MRRVEWVLPLPVVALMDRGDLPPQGSRKGVVAFMHCGCPTKDWCHLRVWLATLPSALIGLQRTQANRL